jgi:hypothetical protein
VAGKIKVPNLKVRIKRTGRTGYVARVMGANDLPANDGPELFGRPYIRDLAWAKTFVGELLGARVEQIQFVVEE